MFIICLGLIIVLIASCCADSVKNKSAISTKNNIANARRSMGDICIGFSESNNIISWFRSRGGYSTKGSGDRFEKIRRGLENDLGFIFSERIAAGEKVYIATIEKEASNLFGALVLSYIGKIRYEEDYKITKFISPRDGMHVNSEESGTNFQTCIRVCQCIERNLSAYYPSLKSDMILYFCRRYDEVKDVSYPYSGYVLYGFEAKNFGFDSNSRYCRLYQSTSIPFSIGQYIAWVRNRCYPGYWVTGKDKIQTKSRMTSGIYNI